MGKGKEQARLLYREWYQKGTITGSDPAFNNAKTLLEKILLATDFSLPTCLKKGVEDQTEKYALQTREELEIEMVVLPMKAGITLCISSQVGCRMGCAFCETGKMGLIRHLSTEEIVSQVFLARHQLGLEVRNLVFMGMGEPLDNYEAVMQAILIFTDMNGLALGMSRITVSTSGLVDKIYRLIEEASPALNLAVSVNSPTDLIRNRLMPINKQFDMASLKEAMEAYCLHPRRRLLIEYILIRDKTDRPEHAEALATYLKGLRVTVNLIPYNPQSRGILAPSKKEEIDFFLHFMKQKGFLTFVRGTKGQKIMAACGQLGNRALKKKKILVFSS